MESTGAGSPLGLRALREAAQDTKGLGLATRGSLLQLAPVATEGTMVGVLAADLGCVCMGPSEVLVTRLDTQRTRLSD